jgi:hypothetical protein
MESSFDEFFARTQPKEKDPKIKVTKGELSSFNTRKENDGLDFGYELSKKVLENEEEGNFMFNLIDHLASLTGDLNDQEQRKRAEQTIRDFIRKGYLRMGMGGKFFSNIDILE